MSLSFYRHSSTWLQKRALNSLFTLNRVKNSCVVSKLYKDQDFPEEELVGRFTP